MGFLREWAKIAMAPGGMRWGGLTGEGFDPFPNTPAKSGGCGKNNI